MAKRHRILFCLGVGMCLTLSIVGFVTAQDRTMGEGTQLVVTNSGDGEPLALHTAPDPDAPEVVRVPIGSVATLTTAPVEDEGGATWIRIRTIPGEGWTRMELDGRALFDDTELDTLLSQLSQTLIANPSDAVSLFRRGLIELAQGHYAEAEADFSAAIERQPSGEAEYYHYLGVALYFQNRYSAAIEEYNHAVVIDSEEPALYKDRGNAFGELGNHQQAIREFSSAIDRNPYYLAAYNNRGLQYYGLGDYQSALQDYNYVIQYDPYAAYVFNNRGLVYKGVGNVVQAVLDFKEASST